jgi:acyl carrier protein
VGRKDQQVKLRGFRIELNEIEAVLNGHESVRESVVVVRSSGSGDKRLVAYVVKRAEAEYSELALRQYLKQKLPEYMVPAVLVQLAELPLGTTGKVDRQALPEVEAARPELETKYVAPRTAVEEDLARIWREVLVVPHVGVEDNFFELGGHSLMATQVLSRVREVFNLEVPLRVMFQSPTIAGFAIAIVQLRMAEIDSEEAALVLDEVESLSMSEARRRLGESPGWTAALTKH